MLYYRYMTREEMVKRFALNIEKERVKMNLSQEQMATKLDMSLAAYKRLITCSVERIDLYTAYRLYLLTGKLAYEFLDYSNNQLVLKSKISGLTPSQVSYVEGLIDFEKNFASIHAEDYEDYVTVYIPTGNMEDGMIYDTSNVEKVNVAQYRQKYGNLIHCGLKITSNHLHPAYNKGDILLVSRQTIRDGDTGVFINRNTGCAYIRKFYQTSPCRLEPISDYGMTIYVDDKNVEDMSRWIKFGYVITKIR